MENINALMHFFVHSFAVTVAALITFVVLPHECHPFKKLPRSKKIRTGHGTDYAAKLLDDSWNILAMWS